MSQANPTAREGSCCGNSVKYNENFIYFLFILFIYFVSVPFRKLASLNDFSDANSQKGELFGGFVDTAPQLGGKILRNSNFYCCE